MPASSIGWAHFAFAIAAIAVGGSVGLLRKATRAHVWLGRTYAVLMLGLNATAFMLYRLFGHFGPFHAAALVSLLTIVMGWLPARRRRPAKWIGLHALWMSWSYVGLLAAAAAETLSRVPDTPFWGMVVGASLAVVVLGGLVIRARLPWAVERVRS